jgi:hypothetical protein
MVEKNWRIGREQKKGGSMKFLLAVSLLINVGLVAYAVKSISPKPNENVRAAKLSSNSEKNSEAAATNSANTIVETNLPPLKFTWAEVESPDYKVYVANLRAIGCPEKTIRDIISAELEDWFLKERKTLLDPLLANFWETTKGGLMESFKSPRGKISELEKERDKLLKEVLGNADVEKPDKFQQLKKYADFLSPEKLNELGAISDQFVKLRRELSKLKPKPAPEEIQKKMDEFAAQQKEEIKNALSPEEYDEYKLRNSPYAHPEFPGLDTTSDELKAIARIQMESDDKNSKITPGNQPDKKTSQTDEEIKQLLGADRFADFKRAQDGAFTQIYQVTKRLNLPKEVAVEVDDIRKAATAQLQSVEKNSSLAADQREEALRAIQEETQKTMEQTLGTKPLGIYKQHGGDWINHLAESPKNHN